MPGRQNKTYKALKVWGRRVEKKKSVGPRILSPVHMDPVRPPDNVVPWEPLRLLIWLCGPAPAPNIIPVTLRGRPRSTSLQLSPSYSVGVRRSWLSYKETAWWLIAGWLRQRGALREHSANDPRTCLDVSVVIYALLCEHLVTLKGSRSYWCTASKLNLQCHNCLRRENKTSWWGVYAYS